MFYTVKSPFSGFLSHSENPSDPRKTVEKGGMDLRLRCLSIKGVANDASKTMGLAKFSPKFTGLAISFFLTVVRVLQSRFFSQTCLAESMFSRLRKPLTTDLFIS